MNTNVLTHYLVSVPAIFIVITIHEFTKAAVSSALGDVAPKNDGRLTLNPIKHFEPVGFIFLLFMGFGWGKPVRTSSVYYKNRTSGTVLTYTMPIIANLIFSFIFALCSGAVVVMTYRLNIGIESAEFIRDFFGAFFGALVQFNLSLAFFNIIPVAPLCGNKIMTALMSPNQALRVTHYEKIFQIILVMLLFFGIVGQVLSPLIVGVIDFYNFIISLLL